jgi:ankyrin repeat protein
MGNLYASPLPVKIATRANRHGGVPRAQAACLAVPKEKVRAFFGAIDRNRIDVVSNLLKKYPALADSIWNRETALNEAIASGGSPMAVILLQYGADPNQTCRGGWKPLDWAASVRDMARPFNEHGGRIHRSVLDSLIRRGARVNAFGKHGYTALMAAASYSRLRAVCTLLKDGADPYAQTSEGRTAFDLIGKYRANVPSLAVAKALLSKAPSIISLRDWRGRTPLMFAVINHDFGLVRFLISKGVNVNARDGEGSTPLMFAALSGQKKIARYLLKHGADAGLRDFGFEGSRNDGHTAAYYAAFYQHFRLAKILRRAANGVAPAAHSAPVSRPYAITQTAPSENSTASTDRGPIPPGVIRALFQMIHRDRFMDYHDRNHMEALLAVLDTHPGLANASWNGRTALMEAMGDCRSGRLMAVILLQHGADPNKACRGGWKPLEWAASIRAMAKPLNEHGGRLHRSVLDSLISCGARVNAFGKHGYTALMAAASYNRLRAVRTLLRDGADPYAQTSSGKTAIDLIGAIRADGSLLPVAGALLSEAPSLISLRDRKGRTPLMCAVINHHFGLVRFLVSKGANVNARDGNGLTPLMLAASRGEGSVVGYLLAHGADAGYRDYHENSAAYYARSFKHYRLARMLRRAAERHQGSDER